MITVENYLEKTKNIDFSNLPSPIQKTHDIYEKMVKYYDRKPQIKKTLDLHIEKLNQTLQKKIVKTEPKKQIKTKPQVTNKTSNSRKKRQPVKKTTKKIDKVLVNHWDEDDKLIRRFIALIKLEAIPIRKVELLHKAISKAMINRKVRKTDDDADLLNMVNTKVEKLYDVMTSQDLPTIKVGLTEGKFKTLIDAFKNRKIDPVITTLNAFVNIQGSKPNPESIERLLKRFSKLEISNHRLKDDVQKAIKILESFNKIVPTVQQSLSGIKNVEFKIPGFESAAHIPDSPVDIFQLPGHLGTFLQDIQPHQALILIKGTKHTSKSQLAMQMADGFAELGMVVAYLDYEQGGVQCKDTQNSMKWNLKPQNKKNVFIKGYVENPMEELKIIAQQANVFIADSVTDLGITADQLNFFRKTYPEVIWVFISQVKENGSMYGGNKMAHNPTAIIECHPDNDPEGRYATLEKNRGNDLSICYDIFQKKAFVWEMKTKEVDGVKINVRKRKYL